MVVDAATVGPGTPEAIRLPCKGISLELPLWTGLDGGCMLIFLRPGVISFHVMPPSEVDSMRPSLEDTQPWATSLKLRLSSAAPLGTSGISVARVSVDLAPGPSLRSETLLWSSRFGARTVESTTATTGKFAVWSSLAQLSKCKVLP